MIGLYSKALNWVVDQVKAAVKGAIDFAKNAIAALANFAALVKDIASNPGQWLKNLGAAIVDGVKNHLWKAFKTAVQNWFNDKVEELIGFGKAIWNLLKKGGMGLVEVGKMLWEGVESAVPGILIGILIEKLVSMLVPAAGAVLLIIQSIQAAWGTIKRVLAALDKFMTFLRAVKSGSGGPMFAGRRSGRRRRGDRVRRELPAQEAQGRRQARSAARSARSPSGSARSSRAVGKKIWGGVKKGAKSAFGAIKKGAKAAWGGIKKGASAVGRGLGRAGAAAKRMLGRVGKAIGRATGRAREALKKQYARLKERYEKWKNKPLTKEQVLAKVSRALAIALAIPISSAGWNRGVLNFVCNRYRKHGRRACTS